MVEIPKVVAEIGCNHKGEMDIAKELISTAAIFCKADYVKFQKRNNRELLSDAMYNAPHPNPANSYGGTYGDHREFLEFSVDQHRELNGLLQSDGHRLFHLSVGRNLCARDGRTRARFP